jgi:hypothetical protein
MRRFCLVPMRYQKRGPSESCYTQYLSYVGGAAYREVLKQYNAPRVLT